MTLLFVEDDENIRLSTRKSLDMLFGNVIEAVDGQEGLEKFVDFKPDIVLTDIKMPIMDGITLSNEIRKLDSIIPIIFFTAHNEIKLYQQAIELQVQGYLIKPALLKNFIEVFEEAVNRIYISRPMILQFENETIYNFATNQLEKNGIFLVLSQKEREVLQLLAKKFPHIVSKEEMSKEIWPMKQISNITIKNTIARLREKIGHKHIVSIHSVGWRLELT